MKPSNLPPLGITMGDASGIGPELVVRLFAQGLPHPAVVFGDAGQLRRTAQQLGLDKQLAIQVINTAAEPLQNNAIPVIACHPELPTDLPMGVANATAGAAAYAYLCAAIDAAMQHAIAGIVTAPLHKHAMQLAGVTHPGHTEILAERSNTQHVAMMLANAELRVILCTIHVALAHVPALITFERVLRTIEFAQLACQQAGIQQPRIAVAGLNPHAGEDGQFGDEEITVITPAIEAAQQQGIHASGPWPGDTVFMQARQGHYDIVVAQYHDQGLIPVKYLGIEEGVNVTVGLPFIRTSVDHGTAFDIAGKGRADERSLRHAFDLALTLSQASASPAQN